MFVSIKNLLSPLPFLLHFLKYTLRQGVGETEGNEQIGVNWLNVWEVPSVERFICKAI